MTGTAEGNLVNAIMNEMEQENGLFNEENGKFVSQTTTATTPTPTTTVHMHPGLDHGHVRGRHENSNFTQMRDTLVEIIRNDAELDELINSHSGHMVKINEILGSEDLLLALFKEQNDIPRILKEYILTVDEPVDSVVVESSRPSSPVAEIYPMPPIAMATPSPMPSPRPIRPKAMASPYPNMTPPPLEGLSSLAELMVGPLLAAIAFFLVTNTPILYYIGRLPYIGAILATNKLITSLALMMILFTIGSFLIELLGLI